MSSSRSREDRWFAFGVNAIDSITAQAAGERAGYSILHGRQSLIDIEACIEPAADLEAKARGLGHVVSHFNFEWKI